MEQDNENEETPCFIPVIARLDRLDRLIQLLEEKRSFSKIDACAVQSKNEFKTLSSALEEVHHKGTLMERLALLEKRVLALSLKGNTSSRSSSSTVQGSEMIGKNKNGDTLNKRQIEHPSTIQAQVRDSLTVYHGAVKEIAARSRRQKTESQKKWPWLFRHAC